MRKRSFNYTPLAIGAGVLGLVVGAQQAVRFKRRINLAGKVVLITGGSRGLGLVLARRFAREGAQVAVCARNEEDVNAVEAELRQYGVDVLGVQCDVTVPAQVQGMIDGLIRHFGRIDVLVNNAGTISVGPMETMTIADYEEAMKTHFWGPLYTSLAVIPQMKARGSGRILNISSIGGKVSVPHLLPYSASKFALVGFSEGLRSELEKDGIYVTTVCPGLMRTGSPPNATFKGQHRKEYAWFSVSDSTPGITISAETAAARIIRACKNGQAEVMLSAVARIAATVHGVFPGMTSEINSLVNAMLPAPGGIGTERALGRESESNVTRSPLTTTTRQAAVRNNEV
jgi:NAD(P)-dependent dehydrogenase (short-subunit alcohol dehydrogenase family)